ncbi:hypothetical protein B9479_005179 [Cryptococcus floricola]|uniref:BTB domain-containing protein n=1 Tax=Cryptococcus floricola TaxID=2591691 RepID=A0A5D3ATY6_9TREE|nr:hypothetical protein B9479_005179 [Cryptococcus floricola]
MPPKTIDEIIAEMEELQLAEHEPMFAIYQDLVTARKADIEKRAEEELEKKKWEDEVISLREEKERMEKERMEKESEEQRKQEELTRKKEELALQATEILNTNNKFISSLLPSAYETLDSTQRYDMSVDDRKLIESLDLLDVKDAQDTDTSSTRTGSDVGDHPVPLPTANASFTGAEKTLTGDDAAASNAASLPPSERYPDPFPSSIHPDFSVQTSDDFLLVTNDDVGFYVNRDLLLEHSDFFRDFEEMASDMRQDDDAGKGRTQAVRRDMPGALSNGLRVVLRKVKETKYWQDFYDWERKVFRSQQIWEDDDEDSGLVFISPRVWEYDLEDLALAFRIADQYGFTEFSAQARRAIPQESPWFRYLYAAFEADETVAKAIAKSTLRWELRQFPQHILSVLDKHHAPYAALLRDIHRLSPFHMLENPYSPPSSPAANHDFLKKSQADFMAKRLVECGGEECSCKKSELWWATASVSGGRGLQSNLISRRDGDDDNLWIEIGMSIRRSVACLDCKDSVIRSFKPLWDDLAALWQ